MFHTVFLVFLFVCTRGELHSKLRFRNYATNSSVVVIGAAGFIGYHLSATLKYSGAKVFAFDTFTNSHYSPSYKHQRAWALLLQHHVDVNHNDICGGDYFWQFLMKHDVSHIVYLALGDSLRGRSRSDTVTLTSVEGVDSCLAKLFDNSKYSAELYKKKPPVIVYTYPSHEDCATKACNIRGTVTSLHEYSIKRSMEDNVHSTGVHVPETLGSWPRLDRNPYTLLSGAASSSDQVEFSFAGDVARGIVHVMKYSQGMKQMILLMVVFMSQFSNFQLLLL